MFSYEEINTFNDLEMQIYEFILEHKEEIKYMTIRNLAEEVHVSTAAISRFCKKNGCDGYSEFKVQLKQFLKEKKETQPDVDQTDLRYFFDKYNSASYQEELEKIADVVRHADQVIFFGIGTSGILGRYGARYFSNLGKYSQFIEDPYYPITTDMKNTVVIVLSVSGETPEVIKLTADLKEHRCKVISITNHAATTLGKMSDYHLNYYVTEQDTGDGHHITTQIPVVFLLENIGRKISQL